MAPVTEQLLRDISALPIDEYDALMDVLNSNDTHPVPEPCGDAWVAEIRRRSAEIDAGTALSFTWEEFRTRDPLDRSEDPDG